MRILCDACENAAAIVFCAADEAALCRSCDEKNQIEKNLPTRKSWYEQTLEEEEEELEPMHFEGQIDEDLRPLDGLNLESNGGEDDEAQRREVEAFALEWDRNNSEIAQADLAWTENEEGEKALQEDEISQFITEDLMEEDDLLGDEIDDFQFEKQVPSKKKKSPEATNGPTKAKEVGRAKFKKVKKEANRKALSPKGQSGHEAHGAASKRLLHGKKRFSPKKNISNPVSARSKPRTSKPAASGPGNSVFPSSSKSRALPPFDSTGGPKKPPGTTK